MNERYTDEEINEFAHVCQSVKGAINKKFMETTKNKHIEYVLQGKGNDEKKPRTREGIRHYIRKHRKKDLNHRKLKKSKVVDDESEPVSSEETARLHGIIKQQREEILRIQIEHAKYLADLFAKDVEKGQIFQPVVNLRNLTPAEINSLMDPGPGTSGVPSKSRLKPLKKKQTKRSSNTVSSFVSSDDEESDGNGAIPSENHSLSASIEDEHTDIGNSGDVEPAVTDTLVSDDEQTESSKAKGKGKGKGKSRRKKSSAKVSDQAELANENSVGNSTNPHENPPLTNSEGDQPTIPEEGKTDKTSESFDDISENNNKDRSHSEPPKKKKTTNDQARGRKRKLVTEKQSVKKRQKNTNVSFSSIEDSTENITIPNIPESDSDIDEDQSRLELLSIDRTDSAMEEKEDSFDNGEKICDLHHQDKFDSDKSLMSTQSEPVEHSQESSNHFEPQTMSDLDDQCPEDHDSNHNILDGVKMKKCRKPESSEDSNTAIDDAQNDSPLGEETPEAASSPIGTPLDISEESLHLQLEESEDRDESCIRQTVVPSVSTDRLGTENMEESFQSEQSSSVSENQFHLELNINDSERSQLEKDTSGNASSLDDSEMNNFEVEPVVAKDSSRKRKSLDANTGNKAKGSRDLSVADNKKSNSDGNKRSKTLLHPETNKQTDIHLYF